jgi:hypothetical protein
MEKHVIRNWKLEITVGILLFVAGAFLVWDSADNRGRKLPFPFGAFTFW